MCLVENLFCALDKFINIEYVFNSKTFTILQKIPFLNCGNDHPLSKNYGKKNDLCQYENFSSQNKFFISIKIIYVNKNYFNSENYFMSIRIIYSL